MRKKVIIDREDLKDWYGLDTKTRELDHQEGLSDAKRMKGKKRFLNSPSDRHFLSYLQENGIDDWRCPRIIKPYNVSRIFEGLKPIKATTLNHICGRLYDSHVLNRVVIEGEKGWRKLQYSLPECLRTTNKNRENNWDLFWEKPHLGGRLIPPLFTSNEKRKKREDDKEENKFVPGFFVKSSGKPFKVKK